MNQSAAHRSCPSDERLVAAVTNTASQDEQRRLDTHLDTCDRCLDAIDTVLRRLRIADEIPVPVPPALRQRAAAAATTSSPVPARLPEPRPATTDPPLRWMSGVPAWRAAALRLPIMIPAAVAVVAVLMVATQTWLTPPGPRSLTRSVAIPQHVRVTALGAPVRRQPNGHAEVIAMVTRGMVVDVGGEERDWLHVTLPNGTDGWVEQRALR